MEFLGFVRREKKFTLKDLQRLAYTSRLGPGGHLGVLILSVLHRGDWNIGPDKGEFVDSGALSSETRFNVLTRVSGNWENLLCW